MKFPTAFSTHAVVTTNGFVNISNPVNVFVNKIQSPSKSLPGK